MQHATHTHRTYTVNIFVYSSNQIHCNVREKKNADIALNSSSSSYALSLIGICDVDFHAIYVLRTIVWPGRHSENLARQSNALSVCVRARNIRNARATARLKLETIFAISGDSPISVSTQQFYNGISSIRQNTAVHTS